MKIEKTTEAISISLDLQVPPEQAWVLLTQKPHVSNWWGDYVELQARLGGKLLETWHDGSREIVTSGEVTRCDPPSALEMSWADDDWPGSTRVAFYLSGDVHGTRLILKHSGWSVHSAGKREKLIDGHAQGWSQHLVRLAGYAAEVGNLRMRSEV
jgi:uncharacterized protein YndB with AHSA1/START domain